MYYVCTWCIGYEHYALAEKGVFLLFKRKRDAKARFEDASYDPEYEAITLERAKELFGNNFKIIK